MTVCIKELRRRIRYDSDTGGLYWRPRSISRGWDNSRAGRPALNSIRRDNRLANLRDVSSEQNSRNMKLSARNKSGVIGVYWNDPRNRK